MRFRLLLLHLSDYSKGRRHRRRPPESIADEFEELQRLGARYAFVVDSVFNSSPAHVIETCEAILRRGVKLAWGCFLRPQGLDAEQMGLMAPGRAHAYRVRLRQLLRPGAGRLPASTSRSMTFARRTNWPARSRLTAATISSAAARRRRRIRSEPVSGIRSGSTAPLSWQPWG